MYRCCTSVLYWLIFVSTFTCTCICTYLSDQIKLLHKKLKGNTFPGGQNQQSTCISLISKNHATRSTDTPPWMWYKSIKNYTFTFHQVTPDSFHSHVHCIILLEIQHKGFEHKFPCPRTEQSAYNNCSQNLNTDCLKWIQSSILYSRKPCHTDKKKKKLRNPLTWYHQPSLGRKN